MESPEVQYLIFLFSIALGGTVVSLVILISYMQKKKTEFILDREREKAKFEEQLLKAEVEITEQNLKNISWELHDNIGQLLSVASMETKMLMQQDSISKEQLEEVVQVIGQSIAQVRGLSKTLNSDMIKKLGLKDAIQNEFDRLNRIGLLQTFLEFNDEVVIDDRKEIIIFRMLQEFISNVIKHAQASELKISVKNTQGIVQIEASDNGIGFDIEKVEASNGLLNLESRAKMISGDFSLNSTLGKGTVMHVSFDNKISDHEEA
ncbi:MAG: histidine kinase [Saprospiraceae bacterium]|nr:histidine kinase [Saprospiraceae bacterium]